MRQVRGALFLIFLLLTVSALGHAQGLGTISGVAKDASGAVLPGVTVEVASPALIEKSRMAVTNESGQYTIVSLPPGVYSVTFTLPGFSTTRREGIEKLANFTAQVNADMKVGGVTETVEVTAEPPLFDVQVSGHAGDAPSIGVQSNLIPRTGGNSFHGTFLVNGSSGRLQSDNLTTKLKALGLTDTTRLKNVYDVNGGFGGPIAKDRLWFFSTGRYQTNTSYIAGLYFPSDPKSWIRTDDNIRQP